MSEMAGKADIAPKRLSKHNCPTWGVGSMASFIRGRQGKALVAFLLVVQLAVFSISISAYEEISVFCAGPTSSKLMWPFFALHLLFLALLVLGPLSFKFLRLRAPYVGMVTAALVFLPVQVSFVHHGLLTCNAP